MPCRKHSPGNPCCEPLDPTCETACDTYADVISYAVTVEGMSEDFVFDLFPYPAQPSCQFYGGDCFKTAVATNSTAETSFGTEDFLSDNCASYFNTCQEGLEFDYTRSGVVYNFRHAVMQQDRFDINLTLRPVYGSTTTLRFTASMTYHRYIQLCTFVGYGQAYSEVHVVTNGFGLPNTCTFDAWTYTGPGTAPAYYLPRNPIIYTPDFDDCPFDWTDPPTGTVPTEVVGNLPTILIDEETSICTIDTIEIDVYGYTPGWYDYWLTGAYPAIGECASSPYAASTLSGYEAFFYDYESATFECDAFPANPIELKRIPYTDIAAGDSTINLTCPTGIAETFVLGFRTTSPAIPKSLYVTI